jgi:hypothetical protein
MPHPALHGAARGSVQGARQRPLAQKAVIDSIREGEVLVIEAREEHGAGTIGDILALRPAGSRSAPRRTVHHLSRCWPQPRWRWRTRSDSRVDRHEPVASALRDRTWRVTHWLAYLSWPLAFAHSIGIGSDTGSLWFRLLALACLTAVLTALVTSTAPAIRPRSCLPGSRVPARSDRGTGCTHRRASAPRSAR